MPELSPLTANIAVVALESLLYGVYAILASCAFYFMMARRRECLNGTPWFCHSSLFSPVALEALALFITVTIRIQHWLLTLARLFVAFRHWEDGPGPRVFYSDFSHITAVLRYGFGCGVFVHWGFTSSFGVGLTYQMSAYTSNDIQLSIQRYSYGIICGIWSGAGIVWKRRPKRASGLLTISHFHPH
ncbi:hypothetical protein C8J57DRAFT_1609320 [Mycena rebaudengoi]|nr:hypothetical protein C8J57DRAFT_1609320 [Mycena rebaudengoi]